jgi:hypothetical protein
LAVNKAYMTWLASSLWSTSRAVVLSFLDMPCI